MRYRFESPWHGRRTGVTIAILLVLLMQPLASLPAGGTTETTDIMDATLPTPRDGTSAATIDGFVYIFGGDTGVRSQQVVRYDPITDTATLMAGTLPSPRSGTSAVSTGDVAYIFGGWDGGTYHDDILRYDPTSDTVSVMGAQLPEGMTYTSAVWSGEHAYIFGGGVTCSPCTTDTVLRYDPTTDTVTTMGAKLPSNRYGTSAVWDGLRAYIFGGVTASSSTEHDDILVYDPAADQLDRLDATLPSARYHTAATLHDGRAYVLGGFPCEGFPHYCDDIVAFDPLAHSIDDVPIALSAGRYLASAATRGDEIFIFGGYDGARSDDILGFRPGTSPPSNNAPPVLDPITDLSIIAGDTGTRVLSATDPDGDPLTISITSLPAGAALTDHGDGTATLTWSTSSADTGVYDLTGRADDGRALSTYDFRIYVDADPPPVVRPIPDDTLVEGSNFQLTVTTVDPDGDPITLTMGPLPTGATFTDHGDGTGTLDWAVGFGQSGTYPLTATASDGTSSDTEAVTYTVIELDRPPQLGPLGLEAIVTGAPYTRLVQATDPDGDAVALAAVALPNGASFTDHGDGTATFEWTPTDDQSGVHQITISAESLDLSDTGTLTLDARPPYAFTLRPLSFGFLDAKPGQVLEMDARLTNTGYHSDTYRFSGYDIHSQPEGWPIQAPGDLTLARDQSDTVTLTVEVPPEGTYSKPRLRALSDGDNTLRRILTSIVDVPIHLDIELLEDEPAYTDTTVLFNGGNVTATWWDGTPVVGREIRVFDKYDRIQRLSTMRVGETDSHGVFVFDLSLDPIAMLPGAHEVTAQVQRNGRTDHVTEDHEVFIA